ncbi:MAG: FUSC family protein [Pirellulales bacterium]
MSTATAATAPVLTTTGHALRVASAAAICLVVVEWLGLQHGNLAVWTTYMVMAQHPFTIFQKGFERVLGRTVGILIGLALATWLAGAPGLGLLLEAIVLWGCTYLYLSGRLAYTFLNMGLYTVAMYEVAHASPATAPQTGWQMFLAVLVGVAVASAVSWASRSESGLHIETGGQPLWPVNSAWASQALMLAVTALLTQLGARWLDLSPDKSVISVLMLMVTPDLQSMLQKGELRLAGAALAVAWSVLMFVVLALAPHFLLLVLLVFLGMYLAAGLAHAGGKYAYAGVQMGLVMPMVAVAPASEFGNINAAGQRIEGILLALAVSLVVGSLWPRYRRAEQPR